MPADFTLFFVVRSSWSDTSNLYLSSKFLLRIICKVKPEQIVTLYLSVLLWYFVFANFLVRPTRNAWQWRSVDARSASERTLIFMGYIIRYGCLQSDLRIACRLSRKRISASFRRRGLPWSANIFSDISVTKWSGAEYHCWKKRLSIWTLALRDDHLICVKIIPWALLSNEEEISGNYAAIHGLYLGHATASSSSSSFPLLPPYLIGNQVNSSID